MRSWSDFFSMGGYAFYVWGSYLVSLLAIGAEVLLLRRRKRREATSRMARASESGGRMQGQEAGAGGAELNETQA